MKNDFNKEDKEFFENVVFLVEATSYEYHSLWADYSTEYLTLPYAPKEDERLRNRRVDWKQESAGWTISLGVIDKRPICVSINYAILNGKRVMFYYGCSQLVDHQIIENWLKHFTSNIKWDNGVRWAHCDAFNFHHCLEAIKTSNRESI